MQNNMDRWTDVQISRYCYRPLESHAKPIILIAASNKLESKFGHSQISDCTYAVLLLENNVHGKNINLGLFFLWPQNNHLPTGIATH